MDEKLRQFSVIVIDDDQLVRKLVYQVLHQLGFGKIHKAADGGQALKLLETEPVDLMICDWRMPHVSGAALVQLIRKAATPVNPIIPIIMLTGNAEAHHVIEARDAGANEYLVKPFTVKELCKRISEIVDRPREFVIAPNFKGPSRRRRNLAPPGPERRTRNVKPVKVGYDRRAQ